MDGAGQVNGARLGRRPTARRPRLTARCRADLAWALGLFAALCLGWVYVLEYGRPYLRDPEFRAKLRKLQEARREEPGRPLALILGSSRAGMGLRAECLPDFDGPAGRAPLVFNFGVPCYGPLQQLIGLRRLLAAGVRPEWVFIEVAPPLLARPVAAGQSPLAEQHTWRELPWLLRRCKRPGGVLRRWLGSRLRFTSADACLLLNELTPGWLPDGCRPPSWYQVRRLGWIDMGHVRVPGGVIPAQLARAWHEHGWAVQDLAISPAADRSLRELLGLCRDRGIPAALFLMPEASVFRAWYTPSAAWRLQSYLGLLGLESRVPVVDCRTWMGDHGFSDGHHLWPDAAVEFTARFDREVLQPAFAGRLAPLP